jgi:hypothetical protein
LSPATIAAAQDPSHDLIEQEQIDQIHEKMSDEEWTLAMAWASGQTWEQTATQLGQTPEALRKQLHRVLCRVRQELGAE